MDAVNKLIGGVWDSLRCTA